MARSTMASFTPPRVERVPISFSMPPGTMATTSSSCGSTPAITEPRMPPSDPPITLSRALPPTSTVPSPSKSPASPGEPRPAGSNAQCVVPSNARSVRTTCITSSAVWRTMSRVWKTYAVQ